MQQECRDGKRREQTADCKAQLCAYPEESCAQQCCPALLHSPQHPTDFASQSRRRQQQQQQQQQRSCWWPRWPWCRGLCCLWSWPWQRTVHQGCQCPPPLAQTTGLHSQTSLNKQQVEQLAGANTCFRFLYPSLTLPHLCAVHWKLPQLMQHFRDSITVNNMIADHMHMVYDDSS